MSALHRELELEEDVMFGLRRPPEPKVIGPAAIRKLCATPPGLAGVREQAGKDPRHRFDSLLHHVDVELLQFAYQRLREEGVRGGSGQTWTDYGVDLRVNIVKLYTRLQRGRHRTLPSWRRMVALAQGQRRLLKRAALKDRIVQRAVAEVLQAVYHADFLGFAGDIEAVRSPCDAFERFARQLEAGTPQWIVEARLDDLGPGLAPKALLQCLQHRIGDGRVLGLIERWAKAGVMEDAVADETGPPRGAIAALLMHVYCHYAFDVWVERWCERHARSAVILVRDSQRLIAGFRHKPGARRFLADLRVRGRQWAPMVPARQLRLAGFRRYAREHLGDRTQRSTRA